MYKFILFFLSFFTYLSLLTAQAQPGVFDKVSLMQDLAELYAYVQEDELFDARIRANVKGYIDSLAKALPDTLLPPHTYAWYIREATFRTEDTHVYLMQMPFTDITDSSDYKLIPWRFGIFGSEVLLTTTAAEPLAHPGDTIVSINDIPASEIRYKLSRYYPTDYPESFALGIGLTNSRSAHLFFRVFGGRDSCSLVIRRGKERIQFRGAAVQRPEKTAINSAVLAGASILKASNSLFTGYKLQGSHIYYLDVRALGDNPMENLYLKFRDSLPDAGQSAVIVDLRGLSGGPALGAHHLFSGLTGRDSKLFIYDKTEEMAAKITLSFNKSPFFMAKKKNKISEVTYYPLMCKNKFDQFVVLCDQASTSSATLICAWFRLHTKALFIGEETGGSAYGCSKQNMTRNHPVLDMLILSNSGISLNKPAGKLMTSMASPPARETGVLPDIYLAPTAIDLATGRDPVLERAVEEANRRLKK